MVALLGFIENKKQVNLDFLFPKTKEVFASWFTGDTKIPHGKMIKRINLGYESIFENDLILTFNKGILINETLIDNINQ